MTTILSRGTADQLQQLSRQIQMLQQFQRLLTIETTPADVTRVLALVEADYGAERLLEDMIQRLVGQHLALQIEQRDATRRYICKSKQPH